MPLSAMLNVEHALTDPVVGDVFQLLDSFSELDVMAAYLVYLRSLPESKWRGYLHSLPGESPNPLHYDSQRLSELQASYVCS